MMVILEKIERAAVNIFLVVVGVGSIFLFPLLYVWLFKFLSSLI